MTAQGVVITGVTAATGALGIVAQVPAQEIGGDYSKYGVIGILGTVIVLLICYGLPKLMESHKENFDRLADEVKDAGEKQTTAINAGNDKVATLLQSTLHQLFEEMHQLFEERRSK